MRRRRPRHCYGRTAHLPEGAHADDELGFFALGDVENRSSRIIECGRRTGRCERDEHSVSPRSRIEMSRKDGWSDSEADRSGAGVKALVPHRDGEICRAECKRTGEMHRISPAELMRCCKRTGSSLDVG